MKSERYPNIYRYEGRGKTWFFRKYSSVRRGRFFYNTQETDEKAAYSKGLAAFDRWERTTEEKAEKFGEFAEALLERKFSAPLEDFSQNSRRSTLNSYRHLVSAFRHLELREITEDLWKDYVFECRREKPQKFFNRRKALIEIMSRAFRRGKIKTLPEFYSPDKVENTGRYVSSKEVTRILKKAAPMTRMLALIVYRQGARPGEVIRYQWDMIDWGRGTWGYISIPGAITKTRRSRSIPLHPEVSDELKRWQKVKRKKRSPYIFLSPRKPKEHIKEYKTGWRTACNKAKSDATVYDLRRSFITDRLKAGVSKDQLAKYLDTSPAMIDRVYNQAQEQSFEEIAGWENVGDFLVKQKNKGREDAWLQ